MLTLINGCKVVSDEGFEVELHMHRDEGYVTYHDGTKGLLLGAWWLLLAAEAGDYLPLRLDVPDQLKWNHPRPGQELSEAEKTQVVNRIRDAFDVMGTPVLVKRVKK